MNMKQKEGSVQKYMNVIDEDRLKEAKRKAEDRLRDAGRDAARAAGKQPGGYAKGGNEWSGGKSSSKGQSKDQRPYHDTRNAGTSGSQRERSRSMRRDNKGGKAGGKQTTRFDNRRRGY